MVLYSVQATPKPHPQLTQSRLFETTFEHLRTRPNINLKSHTKSNRGPHLVVILGSGSRSGRGFFTHDEIEKFKKAPSVGREGERGREEGDEGKSDTSFSDSCN